MDKWIYEKFDGWACYLQTRRGWNLERAKVWTQFVIMLCALYYVSAIRPSVGWFFGLGIAHGLALFGCILCFKKNGDYAESIRKCAALNAIAMARRDASTVRKVVTPLSLAVIVGSWFRDGWDDAIVTTIWFSAHIVQPYLECCFYLGPGSHSRELNKQTVPQGVTHDAAG